MRITSKGQVTIPQEIREHCGLLPHTEVRFVVDEGRVWIEKHCSEPYGSYRMTRFLCVVSSVANPHLRYFDGPELPVIIPIGIWTQLRPLYQCHQ